MKVLKVRNVHEALPIAVDMLLAYGIKRDSRNGLVLQYPYPVATVFENPCERVLFWPERDANPFFHLYESLWMLAGRNDLKPLLQYVKDFGKFSDDGNTLHGAYGYRWRNWFADWSRSDGQSPNVKLDQLELIKIDLEDNKESRRSVLQMWDGQFDLGRSGKDLPCNLTATFQRDATGALHLVVFCRSNDIIWGTYGANAVHFSMLLEYMAAWIGCPIGTYTQISVNWHGYLNTLEKVKDLKDYAGIASVHNPYADKVRYYGLPALEISQIDACIKDILQQVDNDDSFEESNFDSEFFNIAHCILNAHREYKRLGNPMYGLETLQECKYQNSDWVIAAKEWLQRRADKHQA